MGGHPKHKMATCHPERPAWARNLCANCYDRLRKSPDFVPLPRKPPFHPVAAALEDYRKGDRIKDVAARYGYTECQFANYLASHGIRRQFKHDADERLRKLKAEKGVL